MAGAGEDHQLGLLAGLVGAAPRDTEGRSPLGAAVARAGLNPAPYSAHSLRAGFVTYRHLCPP